MPKIKDKNKLTLALTGSFGSGKSTALSFFRRLGAATVDCDRIARELTDGSDPALDRLLARKFGAEMISEAGGLNRQAMAAAVFSNPKKRKLLESILHPRIMKRAAGELAKSRNPVRVVEVPLLFEAGHENKYDASIMVRSSPAASKARLRKRGWSETQIRSRLASQMPPEIKCRKADFILDNTASRRSLLKQVSQMYKACQSIVRGRE